MLKILTAGLLGNALSSFAKSKKGIDLGINDEIVKAVSEYLERDIKLEKEILSQIESARSHDLNTSSKNSSIINNIRGIVRPICTFIAFAWYLYAKIHNIALTVEDYTIIGGILAFWFGFRSIDKKSSL
ncbi:MAG: hypothetical protein GY793_07720 [Proteobacteria bacterium]|nr:hypothetical protein [Pseudomonadota bacterium]